MAEPIVRVTENNMKPERRYRITLIVEGKDSDLDEALDTALAFGKSRYIGIGIGSKKPDGPTVRCRRTRARPRKGAR
jgi:hypothetical protein